MQHSLFVYRGIHYAEAERFGEPHVLPFDPSKDYSERGPVCWQHAVPGDRKWGDAGICEMSEDCRVLSVYTPVAYGENPGEGLPVFIYIHGGAYRHGGSEQYLSDLSELAEREHIVCVSVSYRLGCFGYLYDPTRLPVNLGFQDQMAALRWVHANIRAFGGDPSRITLSGQSAGAQSVAFMLAQLSEPLVSQALLFSAPLGLSLSETRASRMTALFYQALGCGDEEAGRKMLLTASSEELLAAQHAVEQRFRTGMVFQPVGLTHTPSGWRCPLNRVVVTTQADDGSLYVPRLVRAAVSWYAFAHPSERFVRFLRKRGVDAAYHRFTWQAEGSSYGAAHCSELPFFAGHADTWPGAVFMGDTDVQTVSRLRDAFIPRLGRFIRSGEWHLPNDISSVIQ